MGKLLEVNNLSISFTQYVQGLNRHDTNSSQYLLTLARNAKRVAMILEIMDAPIPIMILKLKPLRVLMNMSLPIQSVPKIWSNDGGRILILKSVGKLASIIIPLMKMTAKSNPVSAIVSRVFCLKFKELKSPRLYHGVSLIIFTSQSWVDILINHICN